MERQWFWGSDDERRLVVDEVALLDKRIGQLVH